MLWPSSRTVKKHGNQHIKMAFRFRRSYSAEVCSKLLNEHFQIQHISRLDFIYIFPLRETFARRGKCISCRFRSRELMKFFDRQKRCSLVCQHMLQQQRLGGKKAEFNPKRKYVSTIIVTVGGEAFEARGTLQRQTRNPRVFPPPSFCILLNFSRTPRARCGGRFSAECERYREAVTQ